MKGHRLSLRGRWEGKLLDTQGYQARALLALEDDRRCVGRMTMILQGHHGPIERAGSVTATLSDDGAVELQHEVEEEGRILGSTVKFKGRLCAAAPHAESAIYGTYEVKSSDEHVLSVGVAIFWRFADGSRD